MGAARAWSAGAAAGGRCAGRLGRGAPHPLRAPGTDVGRRLTAAAAAAPQQPGMSAPTSFASAGELEAWLVRLRRAKSCGRFPCRSAQAAQRLPRCATVCRATLTPDLKIVPQASHGVPVEQYGRGSAKSVADLYEEVVQGESALRLAGGAPRREVAVLNLLITNDAGEVRTCCLDGSRPPPAPSGWLLLHARGRGCSAGGAHAHAEPPCAGVMSWTIFCSSPGPACHRHPGAARSKAAAARRPRARARPAAV